MLHLSIVFVHYNFNIGANTFLLTTGSLLYIYLLTTPGEMSVRFFFKGKTSLLIASDDISSTFFFLTFFKMINMIK